jgi:dnd system-associated protein 4
MATLLERFDKKTPNYPTAYRENILDRFSRVGGGPTEKTFSQGKFFDNYYECFIYAAMLGMKNYYRLPLDRAKDGTKFIEIESWKPRHLTLYLFMSLLTLANIELISLEELNDEQVDDKAFELMKLLEEYAHGGFDLINSKIQENSQAFDSPFSAITFLKSTSK